MHLKQEQRFKASSVSPSIFNQSECVFFLGLLTKLEISHYYMYMYSVGFHLSPQGILYTSTLFLPSSSCCSLFLAASCLFCRLLSFFRSLLNCLWLKYLKDHLRWMNTVFAHALAVAIRCMHKYWKNTNVLLIQ